jgi:NAD(P)-dependent dehydrogenase (short-subunit alcohol dehydrogenase family)
MKGKVCVVTGANSGIGKAMATDLARRGATVVMVCRDPARGAAARDAIREASGSEDVELERADLGVLDEVRDLAARLARRERIDVLMNNAGLYLPERRVSADGHEMMLAVNHLAPFLLTNLLMERLKASRARVITTSSVGHKFTRGRLDDLQAERRYVPLAHYGVTKLANILFTREVARRHGDDGVTAHCFHPGAVRTGFAQDEPGLFQSLVSVGRVFLRSPEKGGETGVFLASHPAATETNGRYFVDKKPRRPSRQARDPKLAARLWDRSRELVGLS